jgi:selenocysteine-specific elongation factor
VPPRTAEGVARLPVDRSFVLRGFGTVVTGTLAGGRLREGDDVAILPGRNRARIRGLQVHGHPVAEAAAGRRTAVNLQGVECADVPRGSTVAHPDTLGTTRRAWARLRLLPSAPERLAGGGVVRLHQGTCERAARFRVLGREPDGTLHVELHLRGETVLAPGDRFILRRPAPVDTVGGGVIVDAAPPRAARARAADFDRAALDPAAALHLRLQRAQAAGGDPRALRCELGRSTAELEGAMATLEERSTALCAGSRWFDRAVWEELEGRVLDALAAYHVEQPLHPGMARESLRARAQAGLPQDAWREMLERLRDRAVLRLEGDAVALREHRVVLDGAERELARKIVERFREAGLDPPEVDEVIAGEEKERAGPVIELLLARGELVRVEAKRLFHADALAGLRAKLREYARGSTTIDVAAFKQLAGITRRNAIPLLEYLDGERATRRVGDRREILLRDESGREC